VNTNSIVYVLVDTMIDMFYTTTSFFTTAIAGPIAIAHLHAFLSGILQGDIVIGNLSRRQKLLISTSTDIDKNECFIRPGIA
jgi:hypothetical protein